MRSDKNVLNVTKAKVKAKGFWLQGSFYLTNYYK